MSDTPRSVVVDSSPVPLTANSTSLQYSYALLCVAVALLVRMLLTPYIGAEYPFATVYFAVLLMAWYGGLRPALVTMVLGYLGVAYFILTPHHSLVLHRLADYIGAGIYIFVSFAGALFSEAQHKARTQAEASIREARLQEAAAKESEARNTAMLEAQRKADTQQRFLTEASDLLASSLDYQTTLQSVARLVVPHLADWCAVDMAEDNGTLRRVAVTHIDPAKIALAQQLHERYPPDPSSPTGTVQVVRTGQPALMTDIPDDLIRTRVQDDELYEILKALSLKSYMCVPLVARGRILGAITFIGAESGHRYGPDDLKMAEELARRAAMAVDNALLFQAERERSEQLTLAIQEVHHRVKNNLQAVSALLEMQVDPDTVLLSIEAVQDSLSQIKTIALVHDLLSRDAPMGVVDIAQVLANIATLLSSGMRSREHLAPIRVEAESVWLSTKAATSLALVVNELLTNAIKHNLTPGKGGKTSHDSPDTIEVDLQRCEDDILVVVQDHGPGFPPDFDPERDAHLGLQLVLMLVSHDLHGTITFSNGIDSRDGESPAGGRVEIRFSEQSVPE